MPREHLILCGGAAPPTRGAWRTAPRVVLDAPQPGDGNVHLRVDDISRAMVADLPEVVTDLVELATYVYCADQATGRGGKAEFEYGDHWRRRLHFRVAVRRPDVWGDPGVLAELTRTLSFLSDDDYEFDFVARAGAPPFRQYLWGDGPTLGEVDTVMLFSGGLDSLAGAVEEVIGNSRRVALVSHRPVGKIDRRQQELVQQLCRRARERGMPPPFHVPVWANKEKGLGREYTQRTRSFLFAALGVAVAQLFGLDTVKFYENGVVSLNLPVCAQVLGSRASRTTHPQVLWRMQSLLSRVLDRTIRIENPYLWWTKTEVTAGVRAAGLGELVARTVSCAHTWEVTNVQPHCGKCSQCIDRRLAAVAAGLSALEDPPGRYRSDVLTGAFRGVEHHTMVERVVGMAYHVGRMTSPTQLFATFGEASRALRYLGEPTDAVAAKVFELYRRQAGQVQDVIRLSTAGAPALTVGGGNCILGITGSAEAADAGVGVGDGEGYAPSDIDVKILGELAKWAMPRIVYDIETATEVSRKTVGRRLERMLRHRLVSYPNGARKGAFLTPAGRTLLDRVRAVGCPTPPQPVEPNAQPAGQPAARAVRPNRPDASAPPRRDAKGNDPDVPPKSSTARAGDAATQRDGG